MAGVLASAGSQPQDRWVLLVLERLCQQGLAGERLDDELKVYRTGEFAILWALVPRLQWLTGRRASSNMLTSDTTCDRISLPGCIRTAG